METHAAQDVKMVLMHAGQYPLADGGECAFVVGQKDCLNETGYMNPTNTVAGGWDACARRSWCNGDYKNAIPPILLPLFRQMKVVTANGNGATTVDSIDTFALPAEKEVFGVNEYANSTAEVNLFQIEWYKSAPNRIKNRGGSPTWWSERSPGGGVLFCGVDDKGQVQPAGNSSLGPITSFSPFGCIGKKVTA